MAIKKPIHKLVFFLLLGVGLWFAHKPVWKGFKNWRAGQLLEESREFAAAGKWGDAQRTALSSYQITNSIEAFRILFEAMYQQREARALQAGAALFLHPEATAADRARVLEILIDSNDLLTAAKLLTGLDDAAFEDLDLAYQRTRFLIGAGEFKLAMDGAAAFKGTPREAELDLLLADGLVRSGKEEWQPAAVRHLAGLLGHADRAIAVRAMTQVAAMPRAWIADELLRKVTERFGNDSGLTVSEDLAFAFLRISKEPADLDRVVDEMIARHRGDGLGPLTEWLGNLDEWERIVDVTDGVESLDAASFEFRVNALQRLERYEDLREALKDPPVAAPRPLLLATRAAVETKLNNQSRAVVLWRDAFDAAAADRSENFFYRLAAIARQTGEPGREMEATARALEHPLGAPPTADRLVPLFFWLHRTNAHDRLLSISYKLLQREPANAVLINNYHYLRCLKDESSKHAVEIMTAIVEAFPDSDSYRGTLALALIRDGKPEEALAALDAIGPDPAAFDASERAIYVVALAQLDRPDEARALADTVEWERFPKEEAKVLQGMVGGE